MRNEDIEKIKKVKKYIVTKAYKNALDEIYKFLKEISGQSNPSLEPSALRSIRRLNSDAIDRINLLLGRVHLCLATEQPRQALLSSVEDKDEKEEPSRAQADKHFELARNYFNNILFLEEESNSFVKNECLFYSSLCSLLQDGKQQGLAAFHHASPHEYGFYQGTDATKDNLTLFAILNFYFYLKLKANAAGQFAPYPLRFRHSDFKWVKSEYFIAEGKIEREFQDGYSIDFEGHIALTFIFHGIGSYIRQFDSKNPGIYIHRFFTSVLATLLNIMYLPPYLINSFFEALTDKSLSIKEMISHWHVTGKFPTTNMQLLRTILQITDAQTRALALIHAVTPGTVLGIFAASPSSGNNDLNIFKQHLTHQIGVLLSSEEQLTVRNRLTKDFSEKFAEEVFQNIKPALSFSPLQAQLLEEYRKQQLPNRQPQFANVAKYLLELFNTPTKIIIQLEVVPDWMGILMDHRVTKELPNIPAAKYKGFKKTVLNQIITLTDPLLEAKALFCALFLTNTVLGKIFATARFSRVPDLSSGFLKEIVEYPVWSQLNYEQVKELIRSLKPIVTQLSEKENSENLVRYQTVLLQVQTNNETLYELASKIIENTKTVPKEDLSACHGPAAMFPAPPKPRPNPQGNYRKIVAKLINPRLAFGRELKEQYDCLFYAIQAAKNNNPLSVELILELHHLSAKNECKAGSRFLAPEFSHGKQAGKFRGHRVGTNQLSIHDFTQSGLKEIIEYIQSEPRSDFGMWLGIMIIEPGKDLTLACEKSLRATNISDVMGKRDIDTFVSDLLKEYEGKPIGIMFPCADVRSGAELTQEVIENYMRFRVATIVDTYNSDIVKALSVEEKKMIIQKTIKALLRLHPFPGCNHRTFVLGVLNFVLAKEKIGLAGLDNRRKFILNGTEESFNVVEKSLITFQPEAFETLYQGLLTELNPSYGIATQELVVEQAGLTH